MVSTQDMDRHILRSLNLVMGLHIPANLIHSLAMGSIRMDIGNLIQASSLGVTAGHLISLCITIPHRDIIRPITAIITRMAIHLHTDTLTIPGNQPNHQETPINL